MQEKHLYGYGAGKILRGTLKKIADHDAWTVPATIEDSAALSEIATALQRRSPRPESKREELRNQVQNRAFTIWARRVQGGGSCSGDAESDWFAARDQLGIPQDMAL